MGCIGFKNGANEPPAFTPPVRWIARLDKRSKRIAAVKQFDKNTLYLIPVFNGSMNEY